MSGSGKKKVVRLTEKQIRELTKNMSDKELRQLKESQKNCAARKMMRLR